MEILLYNKCNITSFKYKFEKWVKFHIKNKIININNIEHGHYYKHYKSKFAPIDNDYIYTKFNNLNNNFTYCIINNNNIVGVMSMDENDIDNLILSFDSDWYEIIKYIINFMDNKKNEKFIIRFDYIMEHHSIIQTIIEYFNGIPLYNNFQFPLTKDEYININIYNKSVLSYIIPLYHYKYLYNNNLQINIIGYKYETKKIEDKIFNHITNIGIISSNSNDTCETKHTIKKHRHLTSINTVIMEHPLCIKWLFDNIFIDMFIINNKHIYKIHNDQNDNLILNKLIKQSYYLSPEAFSIDTKQIYIYSIQAYKNACELCISHFNNIDYDSINFYYGNESNSLLYNVINNNNNLKCKKKIMYKKYNYNNINIKLNILDKCYNKFYGLDLLFKEEHINIQSITNNEYIEFNYIYLIQKFDINSNEFIYKFGKTNRHYYKRINEHGNEAKLLLIIDVNNCNIIEKKILHILRNTININQCIFGNEYFLCNDKEYIKNIILQNI